MEYVCPVCHDSLPSYPSEELEKWQRRAFRIIYPTSSRAEALAEADVVPLFKGRQCLTRKLFNGILNDESRNLYDLSPSENFSSYNLRKEGIFKYFNSKANRYRNSFIPYGLDFTALG
jgi:hypothetical protein